MGRQNGWIQFPEDSNTYSTQFLLNQQMNEKQMIEKDWSMIYEDYDRS